MEKPSLDKAKAGAVRFNTDSSQLEIYDGNQWTGILSNAGELLTGGVRGFFAGGNSTNIEFIAVDRTGNATDFGDLTSTMWINKCSASRSRGLIHGERPATTNIDFITIANAGTNASDFGDLTSAREDCAGVCNGTRAIFCGGGETNVIDYVSISQTGNAVDFGDLAAAGTFHGTSASSTRGIIAGGSVPSATNTIQFITFSTTGDAQDFGDLVEAKGGARGVSNSTRAVHKDGSGSLVFITIATKGNAIDFGDMVDAQGQCNTCSSSTRGVFPGKTGPAPSYAKANIEFITFATTGNSQEFGDATDDFSSYQGYMSTGHGGIG